MNYVGLSVKNSNFCELLLTTASSVFKRVNLFTVLNLMMDQDMEQEHCFEHIVSIASDHSSNFPQELRSITHTFKMKDETY